MPPSSSRRGSTSLQQVEVVIHSLGKTATPDQLEALASALTAFCVAADAGGSEQLRAAGPDRLDALVALLTRPEVAQSTEVAVLVLRAAKILARRQDVRQRCNVHVVEALLPSLSPGRPALLASEAANVLLNLCHEPANVALVVRCKGEAALLALLGDDGVAEAHANAAGALQTLSFEAAGRAAVLAARGVQELLRRLQAQTQSSGSSNSTGSDPKLQHRLAGTLHNLTAEPEAVRAIRQNQGIPLLAALLSAAEPGVAAAAAGAVQNLAREAASRQELLQLPDAVPALLALLGSGDVQAAACAAGALANIVHASGPADEESRRELNSSLAGVLAAGMAIEALYGKRA